MERYQIKFDDHFFIFNEAVLYPDKYLNILQNKFKNIIVQLIRIKKDESLPVLLKFLSNYFNNYNVVFQYEKKSNPYPIHGGFSNNDKTIVLLCNDSFLHYLSDDNSLEKLFNNFSTVVGHELVHIEQYIKEEENKLRGTIKRNSDSELSTNEIRKYLSSKYEIMAYAWQVIYFFRLTGKENEEIKSLLQSSKLAKFDSYVLRIYHDNFTFNDNVLKTLYKYMYMYLDGWKE